VSRRRTAAAVAAVALLLPLGSFSGATFRASSLNPLNVFATAADFGPLTVSMEDPGSYLRGTMTLRATTTGTASSVAIQRSPAGDGAWEDVCVDTTAPFSCSLDTSLAAEGAHDFRAVATGGGDTAASSALTGRWIDNSAPAPVTLTDPGPATLAGTRAFSGAAPDTYAGVAEWKAQYAPAGTGTWSDACAAGTEPFSCSMDTAQVEDGLYDLRAVATDRAGNQGTSGVLATRRIDNDVPTVLLSHPGTHLVGTVTLDVTAEDGGGVGSVTIQRAAAGSTTWTTICTDAIAPFECSLNTAALANGLYDLRAVATDRAARTATSVVAGVRVDNAGPTGVALTDPGTSITGIKTFAGTASDGGSGVASWTLQHSPANQGVWTDGCTDVASPYSCSLDTTLLGDGHYDLRVLATDLAGNQTVSSVRTGRRIDNTSPTVTLTDPGTLLAGDVTFLASAADAVGMGSVRFQRRPASSSTWSDLCTDTSSPYTCAYDTGGLTDGLYSVRALATDLAGHTATSVEFSVRVDNTAPTSVSLADPGAVISGVHAFTGNAVDAGSGVTSWRLLYSRANANAWVEICSAVTMPYGCSLDTLPLSDGLYDFRVTATDAAGNVTTVNRNDERVDNVAPTAAITPPAAVIRGTVTVYASGADAGGLASVRIERSPAGADAWTAICTDTSSVYSCSFASAGVADGLYDLRAVATDRGGRVTASTPSSGHRVDNTVPGGVTMADPGPVLTGSVSLSGAATDSGSGIATVRFQYRGNGSGTWLDACPATTGPYACTANSTAITDGLHDFRALATDVAGNTSASTVRPAIRVDNNAPTASMTDPGPVGPGEALGAIASDGAGTGVTAVTLQFKPSAGAVWADLCTVVAAPYSCLLDATGMLEGGAYDFRAVATDGIGLTAQSVIAGRVYDGTAPTVTMDAPTSPGGAYVRGTATFTATAADSGSGLASVRYERAPAGTSTWTTACQAMATPYSCTWGSGTAPDGTYDLRAVAVDRAGNSAPSAVLAGLTVDNTGPQAVDVQTSNAGTPGIMGAGDGLVFTFGEEIRPGSVLGGWIGAPIPIEVRVRDAATDELRLFSGATQIPFVTPGRAYLGLNGNYVTSDSVFAATMTLEGGTVVRIVLGALQSGAVRTSAAAAGTLSWRPSSAITDLAGNGSQQVTAAETGASDAEF
jgi:hypothetical protein